MNVIRATLTTLAVVSSLACASAQAQVSATVSINPSFLIPVAGGCGPNGWRGQWGHCHYAPPPAYVPPPPVYAPPPAWRYVPAPVPVNGCPVGYWRGPWGHCRDTPYHGRLPNGGWK